MVFQYQFDLGIYYERQPEYVHLCMQELQQYLDDELYLEIFCPRNNSCMSIDRKFFTFQNFSFHDVFFIIIKL